MLDNVCYWISIKHVQVGKNVLLCTLYGWGNEDERLDDLLAVTQAHVFFWASLVVQW